MAVNTSLEESIARRAHGNWLSWLVSQQTFWVSVAAVVAFVVLAFTSDVFATQQNLFNVTRNFAFVAIIAIGMTEVIVSGGIGVSLVVGAINGLMIAYVGVPPFVVTLGMLSIARSLAMVLSNNRMVYEFGPDQAQLLWLGGGFIDISLPFLDTIKIPNPLIFLLVLLVLASLAFRWSRWGRYLFAIGGN